jgi:hypothetical protein
MEMDLQPLCYRSDLSEGFQLLLLVNVAFACLSLALLAVRPFLPARRLPSSVGHWPVLAVPLHVAFLLLGVAVLATVVTSAADDLLQFLGSRDSLLLFPSSLLGIPLAIAVRRHTSPEPTPTLFATPSDSTPSPSSSVPRA